MNWESEYLKEVKNDVREFKNEIREHKRDFADIVNNAVSQIQHLDQQRHNEFIATYKRLDDNSKRLDSLLISTGNKIDRLKYWVITTGIGIVGLIVAILKL